LFYFACVRTHFVSPGAVLVGLFGPTIPAIHSCL
jgi:hypothetical protein